jgi:hypothetical protein
MIGSFVTADYTLSIDANQTNTLINLLSLKIKLIFSNTIPYLFFVLLVSYVNNESSQEKRIVQNHPILDNKPHSSN